MYFEEFSLINKGAFVTIEIEISIVAKTAQVAFGEKSALVISADPVNLHEDCRPRVARRALRR